MAAAMASIRLAATVAAVLFRRPGLTPTALRQLRSMAPQRWWTKAPYLPVPPAAYLEFRNVTSTGTTTVVPSAHDVEVWLDWCRSMRALNRGRSSIFPASPPTSAG